MSLHVFDASVIVNCLIPEKPGVHNVTESLTLLTALQIGKIAVRQPSLWLTEVAAVGVRLKPDMIADNIADLQELGMSSVTEIQLVWNIACSLQNFGGVYAAVSTINLYGFLRARFFLQVSNSPLILFNAQLN